MAPPLGPLDYCTHVVKPLRKLLDGIITLLFKGKPVSRVMLMDTSVDVSQTPRCLLSVEIDYNTRWSC